MPIGFRGGKIEPRMGQHDPQRRLLLEVTDDEPIAGRIWTERGDPRPFTGWIGLAATITTWLAECEEAAEAGTGE
jgi:hypothetical protein